MEQELIAAIKNKIIADAKKAEYIHLNYSDRLKLPGEFLEKAWQQVDWDQVLIDVKEEMHRRICNSVIGSMETEIKTDVKKLLAVSGVREKLRMEVYPVLMKVLAAE